MQYQVTGNEFLSLPTIRQTDGAVEGVTFLYMLAKGMIELNGGEKGLICPYFSVNGARQKPEIQWSRECCWIPSCEGEVEGVRFSCTYLTPVSERAFVLRVSAENKSSKTVNVRFGADGTWEKTLHEINETTELTLGKTVELSGWNHMFIWSQKPGMPLFAFAPCSSDPQPFSQIDQNASFECSDFSYDIFKEQRMEPGQKAQLDICFGVGYEGVAAATSAKELLRQGFDKLYKKTKNWLEKRMKPIEDPYFNQMLNTNLFFTFFFASGRCVDTEELCLVTSRSPRYYVSAAYWDRDSLLWAFPAILTVDKPYAREILDAVFTRQARNFGIHSRYIDGTVLEPGFELDELCAPVIALERYVQESGDEQFVHEPHIQKGLHQILVRLNEQKDEKTGLYETFLQPTDDLHRYPFLTYDNALACLALRVLSKLLNQPELEIRAEEIRQAVYKNCVKEENKKRLFAWSVDGQGQYDIYDEPPGSLQLLPYYGFCSNEDEVWLNTMEMIRSSAYPLSFAGKPIAEIGCKHAPHPWVLSICNSLLSGHKDTALKHLKRVVMDNGIACESVHEETGECTTGEAFATCAGFLSYALYESLKQPESRRV